jgi:[acyl-carrier-protein] S-malonyltransferase
VTRALIFPGQGTGVEREAAHWCERSEEVRRWVAVAAAEAGVAVAELMRGGRGLMPTEMLEPLHTAIGIGVAIELEHRGVRPALVAGHSLGEIPALVTAGACGPAAAIRLGAVRGRLMAREAAKRPGGMLALHGVDRAGAEAEVAYAREFGIADFAVHNAPTECVVSGEWPALRKIAARRPTAPVPVAGAWHGATMAGAVDELREAVREAITGALAVPLVANRTGDVVTDAARLPDLLAEQLTHPVEWLASARAMAAAGIDEYVVAGPGRVLAGLLRMCLGADCVVRSIESPADLESFGGVGAR